MNIKKIFIPWMGLTALSTLASVAMLLVSSGNPAWVGAALAAAPLPAYLIGYIMRENTARTQPRLPALQLITLAGAAFTINSINASAMGFSELAATAVAVNGALFVQWFVWVFSSYKREKSDQITIGKPLPSFTLSNLQGDEVSSSSFTGSKTLLVFFRANWCPLCMAQLKEIRDRATRLQRAGVQVKFVSNQGIEHSKQLVEKLELPNNFEILQDDHLKAARALHIEDIGGAPVGMGDFPSDTVMATVIALDEQGNVIFGDETDNYRVRPHPDSFLQVFDDKAECSTPHRRCSGNMS